MIAHSVRLTNVENSFGAEEIIVSKTDLQGRITYANQVFARVAEYREAELVGQPHSIIRHPHMPRCVFKLLWDTIQSGSEIFAYVLNLARSGNHYWVLAHVTPTCDRRGKIVGYHSNRRKPRAAALKTIEPIYRLLLNEEQKHESKLAGMEASTRLLLQKLATLGKSYDEFVWSLIHEGEKQ
jgi:PAS domain S-box-containing protein